MNAPSAEQLAQAVRTMPRQILEERLASGELTALAIAVVNEELSRRNKDGAPLQDSPPGFAGNPSSESGVDSEPFGEGWSKLKWLAAFGFAILIIIAFGSTAKNPADQSFLYGVIVIQALILSGLFRVLASLFSSESTLGPAGKLLVVGALCFALFALTLCSGMAQTGWQGG